MAAIAIIDDNPDQSTTVQNNIEIGLLELGSELEVITATPFREVQEYFSFIQDKNVVVLILDEKLNDQSNDDVGPVEYKGSQLISILRKQLKDFPIFALTVIHTDEDLTSKYSEYDDIIGRNEFYSDSEKYIPKFWRAAKNYMKENSDAFSEYNRLAREVSAGISNPNSMKELQALQAKLELPFSGFDDRNAWLKKYEEQISELEKLNQLLKSKLEDS
ncbi:hypothetical protein [Reichenbachiella versicolor]|uniref:hypothetical protein n=1 Tax=Reichenbachiella versicolor TaxID=1821036 RepID=UPI000D6DE9FA|nr:hypothetical protein [Reichenbachiella versicolor]